MNRLLIRALLAFLVLPGTVGFLVPLFLIASGASFTTRAALIPLAGGTIILVWCVREFYAAGRGTLAPWAPPQTLVITGLYRYSRNPMYVGVVLILVGWALGFRSWALALYAMAVLVAFHLRIILNEEPWLAGTFGDAWTAYRARVPRWIPSPSVILRLNSSRTA